MDDSTGFPVELIDHILLFAFASLPDDVQRLPSPSSRAHPIELLLVSSGFTQLSLPHFYRTVNIQRPQDWATLFNPTDGVLGAADGARWLPSLDVRRTWVTELFLGLNMGGEPIRLPLNVDGAQNGLIDADTLDRWSRKPTRLEPKRTPNDALDLLRPLADIVLPNLVTLIILPLPVPPSTSTLPSEADLLTKHLLALPFATPKIPYQVSRVLYFQQAHFYHHRLSPALKTIETLHCPLPSSTYFPDGPHLYPSAHVYPHTSLETAEHIIYGSKASGVSSNGFSLLSVLEGVKAEFVGAEAEVRELEEMSEEYQLRMSVDRWRWRDGDGKVGPFLERWPGWSPSEV